MWEGTSTMPWCAQRCQERSRSVRITDAALCLWFYDLCGYSERRSSPRKRHRAGREEF